MEVLRTLEQERVFLNILKKTNNEFVKTGGYDIKLVDIEDKLFIIPMNDNDFEEYINYKKLKLRKNEFEIEYLSTLIEKEENDLKINRVELSNRNGLNYLFSSFIQTNSDRFFHIFFKGSYLVELEDVGILYKTDINKYRKYKEEKKRFFNIFYKNILEENNNENIKFKFNEKDMPWLFKVMSQENMSQMINCQIEVFYKNTDKSKMIIFWETGLKAMTADLNWAWLAEVINDYKNMLFDIETKPGTSLQKILIKKDIDNDDFSNSVSNLILFKNRMIKYKNILNYLSYEASIKSFFRERVMYFEKFRAKTESQEKAYEDINRLLLSCGFPKVNGQVNMQEEDNLVTIPLEGWKLRNDATNSESLIYNTLRNLNVLAVSAKSYDECCFYHIDYPQMVEEKKLGIGLRKFININLTDNINEDIKYRVGKVIASLFIELLYVVKNNPDMVKNNHNLDLKETEKYLNESMKLINEIILSDKLFKKEIEANKKNRQVKIIKI